MNRIGEKTLSLGFGMFCIGGCALLVYSWQLRAFHPYDIAFDLQWLNAFALAFLALLILIWRGHGDLARRMRWTVVGLSVWGSVSLALILAGTDFPWNGFWGDQMFRIAMIRKFMTVTPFTDFYYADLPPFYPPFFFWGVAALGKLFDSAPHLILKVGTILVYTVGPALAYWLWRRIVTPLRAGCIVVVTFLIHPSMMLGGPHETLAMILFIPWWLAYVDTADYPKRTISWILGGCLGGLLFMTYYYPFFIGGLALLWRLGRSFHERSRMSGELRRVMGGLRVLLVAAIVSGPYWLPLLISMLTHQAYSSQNRWFHTGHAGLTVTFGDMSWIGLLSLAGLFLVATHRRRSEYAGLLRLLGGILGVMFIGYVLGNLDFPILYVKAKEFGYRLAGAMGGLFVAYLLTVGRRGRARYAVRVGLLILLLVPLNAMTGIVTWNETKLARTTNVRLQELSTSEDMSGKTVLTDIVELPIFTPGHLFVSPGEHYSHPAGELKHRLDFLLDLQGVRDPHLFWLALRHNRWVPVDYLAAAGGGDPMRIRVNVCDYPERFKSVYLRYPRLLVSDAGLFSSIGETRFMRLSSESGAAHAGRKTVGPGDPASDFRLSRIRGQLSDKGKRLFDAWLNRPLPDWSYHFDRPGGGFEFAEELDLVSIASRPEGDSLWVVFALRVTGELQEDYRVFLHVYPESGGTSFENHDFVPSAPSREWQVGEIVVLTRCLPLSCLSTEIHFGLFNDGGRLGEGFWCQIGPVSN